jgi:hypothetical protein
MRIDRGRLISAAVLALMITPLLGMGEAIEEKDTDGDGYGDYEEVRKYGTDPLDAEDHP